MTLPSSNARLALCAAALAASASILPGDAAAAAYAIADCSSPYNYCEGYGDTDGDPAPESIGWIWTIKQSGVSVPTPYDCTGQPVCRFYCYNARVPVHVRLSVYGAGNVLLAYRDVPPFYCNAGAEGWPE